jgi:LmbE family N-acetylglucosaminyl deacetylase
MSLGNLPDRLLVIAPHPDDETIGCGLIAYETVKRGGSVWVAIATNGEDSRSGSRQEFIAEVRHAETSMATAVLGIKSKNVRWLNLPNTNLTAHEDQLVLLVEEIVELCKPNVVLVTASSDPHPDHAALGRAARRAVFATDPALFEYMVWGWYDPLSWLRILIRTRDGSASGAERPFGAVQFRSPEGLECKRRALSCYHSQLGPTAVKVGLPAGTGMLSHRFLSHFLKTSEVVFPVNTVARELIESGVTSDASDR